MQLRRHHQQNENGNPDVRTAFAIPAHNEAGTLGDTLRHLSGRADATFVIADNCTDATAEVARAAGARVYERREGPSGKGAALAWFAEVAAEELRAFDLVVILDADSRLADGFVPAMAEVFAQGAVAAQGFVCPVGADRSPTSALAAYSELLSQQIGDKIRARLGWTVPLRGTGMAFRPDLLRQAVERLRTQVEDVEMSLWLGRCGVRVHFVPGAVVYDPKPTGAGKAVRQRARWLYGQGQVWRRYWRDILWLALLGGPSAWALLWALLAKPKTLLLVVKAALLVAFLLMPFEPTWLRVLLLGAAGLAVAVDVAYLMLGLLVVEDRRLYARALLLSPLYLAMWLWSVGLAPLSRRKWLRARD